MIVSHSLGQIEQICDRSIWICEGKIAMEGRPKEVHLEYLDYMNTQRIDQQEKERLRLQKLELQNMQAEEEKKRKAKIKRYGSEDAKFTQIKMLDADGKEQTTFRTGEKMVLDLSYHVEKKVTDAVFGYGIFRSDGLWVYGTNTRIDRVDNFDIDKDGRFVITMPELNLIPGQYWLDITIEYGEGNPVDYYKEALKFEVVSNMTDVGVARIAHSWELEI